MEFYTKTADWRSPIPFVEGADLHFGGCQLAFWRLKLSWGCFIEKGEAQKVGTLSTRNMPGRRVHCTMEGSPPAPGSLKRSLFPKPYESKHKNKGMRGVRARYDAVLPPNISIVRHPGRPVISGMDFGFPQRTTTKTRE